MPGPQPDTEAVPEGFQNTDRPENPPPSLPDHSTRYRSASASAKALLPAGISLWEIRFPQSGSAYHRAIERDWNPQSRRTSG